ncbi:MAG: RNA polymerase sigma factor [Phycisphaerales bacterium]|jgi:RNA polymerase sigma-70 factor (ECF subfamily)|nr:RNA polymerase sigma factor [Phycisphaerales bacterium]
MHATSDIQNHGRSDGDSTPLRVTRGALTPTEFGPLFERAARKLWCVAAAVTSDRDRASDVVQEAAVIALGKLCEFDPGTSFDAWMAQIVRFVALNDRRKSKRRPSRSADPAVLDSTSNPDRDSPDRRGHRSLGALLSDEHAFDDAVLHSLASLEENARACLLMKTVLGLSYAEIARTLSIPEGTAMSHVHRARKAMRDQLKSDQSSGPRESKPRGGAS